MNIGEAVEHMKEGRKVSRDGWNGKGMYLWLCDVNSNWTDKDGNIYKRSPYVYMKAADDTVVPWLASQTDLLATDWRVLV